MTEETTTEQLVEIEEQPAEPATEYTPPEGWRLLAVGERLQLGDMTVRSDGYCYSTERVGYFVGANQRYIRRIEPEPEPEKIITPDDVAGQALAGAWDQAKAERTIEELRCEVSYVQRLLGESRQRVTLLEELVASLRTINDAQEKTVRLAGQENTDLQHRLDVVSAEWAEQSETVRKLRIELDAAQQVPQAVNDRFEEGWDAGTARAVETIAEWTEPFRTCGSQALALAVMANLPHIMRSLTGLTDED